MTGFVNVSLIGNELALVLSGGQEIYLELPFLRRACPCAACQGEPDAMGRIIRPVVDYGAGAFDLRRFALVGGYGVQLFWADGHGTGIYSLDYLNKLNELAAGLTADHASASSDFSRAD